MQACISLALLCRLDAIGMSPSRPRGDPPRGQNGGLTPGLCAPARSHVVHGYVGNKCAVFPLQLHGYEVRSRARADVT